MTPTRRPYAPDPDFLRIRGFLNETYAAFPRPFNCGPERWNDARHFIAPMIGGYGRDADREAPARASIARWE